VPEYVKVPVADEKVGPGEREPEPWDQSRSSSMLVRVASTSSRELSSVYMSSSEGEGETSSRRVFAAESSPSEEKRCVSDTS
jgi:hypothetical protein